MQIDITRMGGIIRTAREAKGLSQKTLAEKIDASVRSIIAIEKDQRNPTYDMLFRLVHVLDISSDLIFHPDRASYPVEEGQAINEFLACDERERKIITSTMRCLVRELRDSK